ncbi:uncharacterized protein LOC111073698 [Drosophila obscura]|uniref:uncharacterized protein LOC111073698 n=1 Tax=Drosophila obscura TaxID=7282 RepID=UPI001BB2862D|nr:uncharacterized protein LOC111073698 [Drosophila obscura]
MSLLQEIREMNERRIELNIRYCSAAINNERRRMALILRYYRAFRQAAQAAIIGDGLHVRVGPGPNLPPQEYRFITETLNFELEGPRAHRYSGGGDAEEWIGDDIESQQLEQNENESEHFEEHDGPLNLALFSLGRHWSEAQPHFSRQQHVPRRTLLSPRLTLETNLNCSYAKKIFKTFVKMAFHTALRLAYSELSFMH